MSRRVRGIDDSDSEEEVPQPQQAPARDASDASGSELDSSEEEEDDADELAKLKEDFIADDDDAESDAEPSKRKRRRRARRQESDEELDEDDLDLVREASGRKYRRLQRSDGGGLSNMFDDDELQREDVGDGNDDDLDDFIEDDQLSDEEEQHVPRAKRKTPADLAAQLEGLDNDKIEEIFEIFGDGEMYDWALEGEEDLVPQEEISLTDVFEPSELKARMLTKEDNVIRSLDLPERYQLLREHLKYGYQLDASELAEKKQWVADKVAVLKRALITTRAELAEPLRDAVGHVVEFIAEEHYEVPFVWQHRQDFLRHEQSQLLSQDDLWQILKFDLEFHNLREKRLALRDLWNSLETSSLTFETLLQESSSIIELQDLLEWVQYHYSSTLKDRATTSRRRSRFGLYERIRKSLGDLVGESGGAGGLSAANFAKNLAAKAKIFEDDMPTHAPSDLSEQQLAQLVDLISMDMAEDPRVRKFYRTEFEQYAKIDIVLTEDGKKKIDDNSPFFDVKYAYNWSFEELLQRPEFYLRMHEAESQGLVIVRVQYPDYKSTLFEEIYEDYLAGPPGDEWTDFRRDVLKSCSRKVVPLVCGNIREDLRTGCLEQLAREIRTQFAVTVGQAPYKPPELDAGVVPRVLAISPGMGMLGKDAVLAICLDEDGVLIESAKFDDPRVPGFKTELAKVVQRCLPDVIGIAGFTVGCNRVKQLVEEAVREEDLKSGETEHQLEVLWVQDEVARVYRNTTRAKTEFAELPSVAHYCVGLARYLQSPLYEYAALGDEIYSLQLHPSQYLLPREYLVQAIESVFVDTVNLVGVTINDAVRHQSIGNVVQYVCGLGPRKASQLLGVLQAGELERREDLVTKELMGPVVFVNCCAFFRIETLDDPEPLDTTRIHPEDYTLARKMAADALELDEEDIQEYEENSNGGVVAKLIQDDPGKLDELVLEEFAASLEKEYNQRKLCTLHLIREEIKNPFRELRPKYKPPTDGQVFTMLTGETKQTLRPDVVATGIVRKATNRQLILQLSCGVDAVADSGQISDDRSQPISAMFAPGQAVQAAVINVDYKGFFVSVNTCRSVVTATQQRERQLKKYTDPSKWNSAAEDADAQQIQAKIEQEQRQSRIIKHPLFQNLTSRQAEEHLAAMQRGDLVIRPSSRGNDHIAITWKVADQIYQHVDVVELNKPNEYTIGEKLQVGRFTYSDLDELLIMHIQAMARKVDEMFAHEKFKQGTRADVDKFLTAYCAAQPRQSVYAFCVDHKHPGYFLLLFKLGAAAPVKEWYVKVVPNGFELMGQVYPDVPALCNGFKRSFSR